MRSRRKLFIGLGIFAALASLSLILRPGSAMAAASVGKGIPASAITNTSNYELVSQDEIDATYPGFGVIAFKKDGDLYKPPSGVFCTPEQYGFNLKLINLTFTLAGGQNVDFSKPPLPSALNTNVITTYGLTTKDGVLSTYGFILAIAGGATPTTCTDVVGVPLSLSFTAGTAPTGNGKAFYDTTVGNIKAGDFTITDGANIVLNFNGAKVTFHDNQPEDDQRNFKSSNGDFCGGKIGEINFNDADQAKDPLPITVTIPYYDTSAAGKGACKSGDQAFKLTSSSAGLGFGSINNSNQLAMTVLQYSGSDIVSVSNTSKFKLSAQTADTSGKIFVSSPNDTTCGGGTAVLLADAHGTDGTIFKLGAGTGDPSTAVGKAFPGCKVAYQRAIKLAGSYTQSLSGGTAGTDDCVTDSGFDWIICPVVHGLSKTADLMNRVISGQLNFNTKDNLGDSVKAAWAIFKNLVSVIIVIVLLIMILSQAAGDLISAYTFKKLLPKLIVAVIGMQISWDLCVWAIQLANDLGQGIGQLLAAPFGGIGALDLPSLLHRLDPTIAAGVGLSTSIGVVLLGPTLLYLFWPGMLLMLFTVSLSVLVGFATLLVRNAIIILAVIFSPAAFLAYVLPGTDKYWKLWKDNFIKCLLLFPMVMAMIYGGRIFAYVSSGLGSPGAFDLIAVMAGFFGPYFFLPKTFKWGGSALSSASRLINESGALKKTREFGTKELKENAERWSGSQSQYDPFDKKVRFGRRTFNYKGRNITVPMLGGRVLPRLASKSIMPTARGRALTVKKYKTWKEERDAERGAYVDRQYEVADKQGLKAKHWRLNNDGVFIPDDNVDPLTGKPKKGVGSAKLALMRSMLHRDQRERKMATQKLFETKSAIEGQGEGFSLNPEDWADADSPDSREIQEFVTKELRPYVEAEWGLENLEMDTNGHPVARWYMHPEVEALQKNNPQFWGSLGRGDWIPPVLMARYSDKLMDEYDIGTTRDENGNITERDETVRSGLRGKRLRDAERIRYAIRDSYVGVDNIASQPQGFFQEIGRLKDPKLSADFAGLLAGIASAGQGGANDLVKLSGGANSSMVGDINSALAPLEALVGKKITIQDYIDAARENKPDMIPKIPGQNRPAENGSDAEGSGGGAGTANADKISSSSGGSQAGGNWQKSGRGYVFNPPSESASSGGTPSLHSQGQPGSFELPEVKISRESIKQMGEMFADKVGERQFEQTTRALKRAGIGQPEAKTGDNIGSDTPPAAPEEPANGPEQPPNQPPPTP